MATVAAHDRPVREQFLVLQREGDTDTVVGAGTIHDDHFLVKWDAPTLSATMRELPAEYESSGDLDAFKHLLDSNRLTRTGETVLEWHQSR